MLAFSTEMNFANPTQSRYLDYLIFLIIQRGFAMNRRQSAFALVCLLGATGLHGCGAPTPTVDDAPFRTAIADYLRINNMALKVKAIKTGPVVDGEQASLSASLTHEQLGGPSVTWTFQFAKQPTGDWRVTMHED